MKPSNKPLSIIDSVNVEHPCLKPWDEMTGGQVRRLCHHCNRHVHNLSALSEEQVEELLSKSESRICIRYSRAGDGKVKTLDSEPRRPTVWSKFRRLFTMAASIIGVTMLVGCFRSLHPGAPNVDERSKSNSDYRSEDADIIGMVTPIDEDSDQRINNSSE